MSLDKFNETIGRGVVYASETDPPYSFPMAFGTGCIFNGNDYKRFVFSAATTFASSFSTNVGLIYLNDTTQLFPIRSNHNAPKFMQPFPSGMIATKGNDSLKPQSISTEFLARNMPHCLEPQDHGLSTIMKNCSCGYRCLSSALLTLIKASFRLPRHIMSTVWAPKSFRPPNRFKVAKTGVFCVEPRFKLCNCSGIIFHNPLHYM
jgi:hypothetical protein